MSISKKGHVNVILISTIAIIGILAITAVVLLVNNVIIPATQPKEEEKPKTEEIAAEYKDALNNTAVKEVLATLDDGILDRAFSNYEFDQIDIMYNTLVNDVEDFHDKAILYIDKANRIEFYSPNEADQIIKAVEQAHAYDPKDITIMRRLYKLYESNGRAESLVAIENEIDKYYTETISYQPKIAARYSHFYPVCCKIISMSVNDAPGEVNKDKVFDSPNISSSEEEIEQEVDKAAEERKKRETVDIDGIPIEEKEIKYKAEDIKKKGKMNYFVNVEGAEERAKAEAKRKEEAKRAAEKQAEDEKKAAERQKREEQAAAEKKLADEKKQLDEVNAYVKRQKTAKARAEKKEKRGNDIDQTRLFLLKGWRKYVTLGVTLTSIVIIALSVALPIVNENIKNSEPEQHVELSKEFEQAVDVINSDDLKNAFDNYDFETVDILYSKAESILKNDKDIAILYLGKAKRTANADITEVDRIRAAIRKANVYGGDDLDIVSGMQETYSLIEDRENANKMWERVIVLDELTEYVDEGDER